MKITKGHIIFYISYLVLTILCSFLLVKYLGRILTLFNVEPVGEIALQLENANLVIPFYIPLISILVFFAVLTYLKDHPILKWSIISVIVIISFLLTILLTKSNDVLLMRILITMIKILSGGEVSL